MMRRGHGFTREIELPLVQKSIRTSQSRLGEWCYSCSLAALGGIENWVWHSEELGAMRAM
jgi:hypothetical protein